MTDNDQKQLGKTLWNIADQLRGAMNADDFRDYMLSFLFLRYLSDNYEAAAQKELGKDYPSASNDQSEDLRMVAERRASYGGNSVSFVPLAIWYEQNPDDVAAFEKQMRRKVHYIVQPNHLWASIANMARTQDGELLNTLQAAFKYIEEESFESTFQGLFSEINLTSDKLGRKYEDRNAKLCTIISEIAKGLAEFSTGIPVCILVLKKCKKPDDVLFINASEHFDKGKRQNQLTEEHIEKIIETYRLRNEEERYSRRVETDEIISNDYNLNISRYVSTAIAEHAIDLLATHSELVEIEKSIQTATSNHNEFLKELGLPLLP